MDLNVREKSFVLSSSDQKVHQKYAYLHVNFSIVYMDFRLLSTLEKVYLICTFFENYREIYLHLLIPGGIVSYLIVIDENL